MPSPAYSRLDVDERRRQLLEHGADLFATHAYDELSMSDIARAAGISKALLYHYFPSKQDYFQATLAQAAAEVQRRTAPDPSLPPLAQLRGSLEAWLGWIAENPQAYLKLIQSATSHAEVRALIDGIRAVTADRIVDGLRGDLPATPRMRAAALGWLWFMDGACTDWVSRGDFSRGELSDLLQATLLGALAAAGLTVEPAP
jgi:AcrR family transcriptional regulator